MIYLDNSATTQPYEEVIQSYVTVSKKYFANPSSLHKFGGESEKLLTNARKVISSMLQVRFSEVIFTSGGTEGNNIAIKGVAMQHRNRGKHIITSVIEHASTLESFKQLERLGFSVTYLNVGEDGRIRLSDVQKALRDDTILVSLMHVNNETGAIQPIEEIGQLLRSHPKTLFHVDHVQGFSKVPLHFKESGIDLCTISGHKFHSVKGTGVLYVREGVSLEPLLTGGSQESLLRAGTENLPGIVALAKAMRLSLDSLYEKIERMERMKEMLLREIQKLDGAHINTVESNSAPHIVNVSFLSLKPEVLVHELEKYDVYVGTQSACSSKARKLSRTLVAMGLSQEHCESAVRISLSSETTLEEVHQFLVILKKATTTLYALTR